jgi:hypothetical protein
MFCPPFPRTSPFILCISNASQKRLIYSIYSKDSLQWENADSLTLQGCIKYDDIDYGNKNGFSAVGSNNGHNGTGGSAFLHNPEVLKDYVYRS